MKTDLCDVLKIETPILSAPMGGAVGPDLVAAVSNAGGYGVIPLWGMPLAQMSAAIDQLRTLTDRNFAVNLNQAFPVADQLALCVRQGVHAVSLFWGVDPAVIKAAKDSGLLVMSSVGSADEARRAVEAGTDIIIAQGWEAGGHVWGQVATLALIPAVVDAVEVPVVAAGGIADGRGMAAALMLGASGVWVGTRFLASHEATIHAEYRQHILRANETQTSWYRDLYDGGWADAPHRALVNSTEALWHSAGRPDAGSRPGEGEVIGQNPDKEPITRYQCYTPRSGTTGDVEGMSMWCGQGVSLVRKAMSAAEIVEDISDGASRVIRAWSGDAAQS